MSVKITGLNQLLGDLEKRFGKVKMQQVSDAALMAGAKVFVKELESQFETFRDTGASIEEITISGLEWIGGKRTVRIHWRGPEERYRVIHLNEFGTIQNPNPKGKGAIARAMRNSEKAYIRAVEEAVRRGI
ncbi:hypothetical protein [Metabacillus bambusae]|uniref:HK97 gp10 family phage protein n=1 Tax=Metabacillus bambusae TaxID=2795218 RepID=A0ABS3N4W6_9BACI|nr:hypothetical protein [Metabacillus bambusae]MBO1513259.1 hypothetical protein [Metabacillus bambusae]